ncbi:54S ribosomal protein L8, mitochondrial [Collariella sp. IMI 366227]|nr:54S ribosomal protein L8, mitochondrial [Collariella sp. IMI 366227]
MPKLFGEIRERYANRQGGYTRVLRTEPKDSYDQAPSAILELVDGPKDMRFAMTAAAVARDRALGKRHTDLTQKNVDKVTRFRKEGREEFEKLVNKIEDSASF